MQEPVRPSIQAEEYALHQACLRGDLFAERQIYERFKGKMFSMCLRYSGNRTDAEDMLQEGFLMVFRDLKKFRGEGSLEGWVRRVILHVIFKQLKLKRSQQTQELTEFSLESETEAHFEQDANNDTSEGLIRLMQQLPTGFRTVLNLYVLEGYNHREIAEILDISEGTSKSQYMRAKAALRQLFEQRILK